MWANDTNWVIKKIKIAPKSMESSSTSLIIMEMQIKSTLWYHFSPIPLVQIKNSTTRNAVGEAVGKQPLSYIIGENANGHIPFVTEFSKI